MKRFSCLFLALLLVLSVPVIAKDAPAPPHYVDPATVDAKTLLPKPPADGSAETLKEIAFILQEQQTRSPAEIARAKSEVKLDVFAFVDPLGAWFTAKNLPVTTALFKNVGDDVHSVTDAAKKDFARPRPYDQDKSIHPAVDLEKSLSYPSGHATRGMVYALILAELVPDQKKALLARGEQIGEDRVLGGVHFESDVVAGRTLAQDLFTDFMVSPAFQADLAKAKAEIVAVKPK